MKKLALLLTLVGVVTCHTANANNDALEWEENDDGFTTSVYVTNKDTFIDEGRKVKAYWIRQEVTDNVVADGLELGDYRLSLLYLDCGKQEERWVSEIAYRGNRQLEYINFTGDSYDRLDRAFDNENLVYEYVCHGIRP